MKNTQLTLYNNLQDTQGTHITLEDYLLRIRLGNHIQTVIEARKHEHGSDEYDRLKSSLPVVTGSAIMRLGGGKSAKNIQELNGLLWLDIDEGINQAQINKIKADKHTLVFHETIGGAPRFTSVIKININKFDESWLTAKDYYYTNFGVSIDESCKNKNRLRFLSHDPNPFFNEKASLFRARSIKKFEPPKKHLTRYIFSENDFGNIINQITERGLNMAESYAEYVQIGMSLASHFGESGFEYFDAICQPSSKYNYKRGLRDYKGFCKNTDKRISIGTFYYLCKKENIELYSKRTIDIINTVNVGKAKGNPTIDSISKHLTSMGEDALSDDEKELTERLIKDKEDYSELANADLTDTDVLINFIISMYNPYRCTISNNLFLENGEYMDDKIINDVYISCKQNLSKVKGITLQEIRTILTSSKIREVNSIMDLINENKDLNPTGYIKKYIESIPQNDPKIKEYNYWAFKRWLCGAVHNWTRKDNDNVVSPLTLVLTGRKQGTGKTSFFENILPIEMHHFFAESKILDNKDSMRRMGTNLILVDNEFSGDAIKSQGIFKGLVDTKTIVARFAYGYADERVTRRCAIGGTTNESDILRDETGNRRILPIQVDSRIDYELVTSFPSELLIAEAYNLIQNGFDWIIRTEEDMAYIVDVCSANVEINPVEELFFNHFSLIETDEYFERVVMNQAEILSYLNNQERQVIRSEDMKRVYTKNADKMEYKPRYCPTTKRTKRGFELYKRPFNPYLQEWENRSVEKETDDVPF